MTVVFRGFHRLVFLVDGFPLSRLETVSFDHPGRIAGHNAIGRNVFGHHGSCRNNGMLAVMDSGQHFTTETKPALVFDDDWPFRDERLPADWRIDVFVSVGMVRNVDITGKEDVIADLDAVNGRERIPGSNPTAVTDYNSGIVLLFAELLQREETGVLANIDPLSENAAYPGFER